MSGTCDGRGSICGARNGTFFCVKRPGHDGEQHVDNTGHVWGEEVDALRAELAERDAELAAFKGEVWLPLSVREGLTTPAQWAKRGQEFLKSLQEDCAKARAEAAAGKALVLEFLNCTETGCNDRSPCDVCLGRLCSLYDWGDMPGAPGAELLEELERLRKENERLRDLSVWGTTEAIGPKYDETERLRGAVQAYSVTRQEDDDTIQRLRAENERIKSDIYRSFEQRAYLSLGQRLDTDSAYSAGRQFGYAAGIEEAAKVAETTSERLRSHSLGISASVATGVADAIRALKSGGWT